jgi:soluble lytic murein transglycosylase-like protein
MIKEDLIPILVFVAVMIIVIITAPQTSVTNTDIVETATDVIETATDVVEPEPEIKQPRYNVNLSAEVQDCIIAECEKHGINPDIVIAQIKKESNFNPNNIGDGGNSFGLMQIQPRWHSKRMERLGCTDLFDPIQNVKVGIDYLAEKYREYGDIGLALTAYNAGSARNGMNGYAVAVMESVGEVR